LAYRVHVTGLRNLAAASPAAVLCLSLMLIQGLIASPLLVECLPGDGSSLIELIGQDPCHEPFVTLEAAGGHTQAALFLGGDPADPCVDLSMDSFGTTQGAIEAQVPIMSHKGHPDEAFPFADGMLPPAFILFGRARDPVPAADYNPRLLSPLRI
jgi:hypothetical protein